MSKFLANGWSPCVDATFIYTPVHTHTYLFSLNISNLLSACSKSYKLMHYSRIVFKQPQLNVFPNIQDMSNLIKVCSKTNFKKPCHKQVIENNFPVLKCFKSLIWCIRFHYENNKFKDQQIVFANCEEVQPQNVNATCIYL